MACPMPDHGTATCTDSVCGFSCNDGYAACGSACVDQTTDAANCGACGHSCDAPESGTASCV
jgi:hypothetical protein